MSASQQESDALTGHESPDAPALSYEVQPMLDLRFPDDTQAGQIEPDAGDQISLSVEPTIGGDADERSYISQTEILVEAGDHQSPDGADREASTVGTDALELKEEPTATIEPLEGVDASAPEPLAMQPSAAASSALDVATASEIQNASLDDPMAQHDASAPPAPDPEQPSAAQRIAAEASATAEALENLKRLLAHKMPDLTPEGGLQRPPLLTAPVATALPSIEPAPAQFGHEAVPTTQTQTPVDEPPLESIVRNRRRSFEFRGFLAGFALSWALGAALYAYLIFG